MLLTASCIFYMYFKPIYILILFGTIIIDYIAGILIEQQPNMVKRKLLLVISLISNIGILFFFKYFNFISLNLSDLISFFQGKHVALPLLNFLLPIGLSFHTFQAMSYTIEVYRGNQKAERHFGYYSLYVMYFPQLVAGPIERPQNVLHQLHEEHYFDYNRFMGGLQLMVWGLFKKMVIADRLSIFVDTIYRNPASYRGIPVMVGIFFFSIQLYCDFSGYSDVARGVSRIMGIELMVNFRNPFLSKNITEFWRRWHISLSTWFNDYVFTPFVTAKRDWGQLAVISGLLLTFLLSGFWHGAGWTFIVYGLLHGLATVYEVLTKKKRKAVAKKVPGSIYSAVSVVVSFVFVSFSWIFFRSASMAQAFLIIRNALSVKSFSLGVPTVTTSSLIMMVLLSAFLLVGEYTYEKSAHIKQWLNNSIYLTTFTASMCIYLIGVFDKQAFIYFQF